MRDFGNPEERAAALRAALACKELNSAIAHASYVGVNVKLRDINDGDWDAPSELTIIRMERRVSIVPAPTQSTEDVG